MRIMRLRVRNLRRHRDAELELAPGLTIVRGPNEAGKSTLQRALELVLTRKVTSAAGDLDALVPWDGASDDRPEIALDFTYDDEDGGVHEGRVEKSFRGAKGTVRLEVDGQVVTDPARADEILADLSGIPTEAFFRSTASVRHHELAGLVRDEAALRDRLQASISGADRGTSRAKKQLEKALYDLQTRGIKNPGRLKAAEDAVNDTAVKLQAGEDALARLEHDRDTLAVARERRRDAEQALSERRSMLEKARTSERVIAEREAAQARFERYRQAVTVRDEIAALEASHPSAMPLSTLRPLVERLRATEGKIETLKGLLEGEVEVEFEVPPEVKWRPLSRASLAIVALGLVIGLGGFAIDLFGILTLGILPVVAGSVIVAAGVVLAAIGWLRRRGDRLERELRIVDIDRRLRGRSQLQLELSEAESGRAELLSRLEMPDSAAAEERLAAEDAHVAAIEQQRAMLIGLVGTEERDTLPRRRDEAALEIEQKTGALEALGPIAKEPRARERLEVEVRDQEGVLERARDDEATARARVEQNPVDAEEVAGLAERLATWREELAALRRRERVYDQTLKMIREAEQATMQRATRYLERRMVADLRRVTDGRYRRVRVDDATLGIDVFAPERDGWVPVTDLSQGTLDVVYLAARLGLVRLVTGDRRPPLVLDDPFVTLDDQRATRALELLREVAGDFQVLYLTTSTRYDAVADRVVELGGPTATDAGAGADDAAFDTALAEGEPHG